MRPSVKLAVVVIAIAVLVLLAGVAVVQQQEIGNLSHQVSQEAAGTVVINGTSYAYTVIPGAALTYPAIVRLDGVTFNITSEAMGTYVVFSSPHQNVTVVTFTIARNGTGFANGTSISIHFLQSPAIKVTFSDGTSEYYYGNGLVASSSLSSANPWFSEHSNPRAGVMWDSASNSFYLYVSLGSRAT